MRSKRGGAQPSLRGTLPIMNTRSLALPRCGRFQAIRLLIATMLLVAACPGPALAASTTVTRGPYLQRATATSLVVRWRTAAATDSRVRYGTSAGTLDLNADDA